jgi:hypothetical protein
MNYEILLPASSSSFHIISHLFYYLKRAERKSSHAKCYAAEGRKEGRKEYESWQKEG